MLVQTVLRQVMWAERRTAGRIATAGLCSFSDGERSVVRRETTELLTAQGNLCGFRLLAALCCGSHTFSGILLCYVLTELKFVPKPLMSCLVLLIRNQR